MQILQNCFDLRFACPFLGEGVRSVFMLTYLLTIFNFFVRLNSGFGNVCKINFRVAQLAMISRNLILQGFCIPGSKLCKPEVTFAIHLWSAAAGKGERKALLTDKFELDIFVLRCENLLF